MERFDKKFNEIDSLTGRPFSGGHPDGVWIICIIYSFIAIGLLIGSIAGLIETIQGDIKGLSVAIASAISFGLYVTSIVQLFKRSVVAIGFIGFLSTCFVIGALGGVAFQIDKITPILAASAFVHIYIFYYTLGLKKDELLK